MTINQFIIDNLKEGESCREMVMGDGPLFTQDHYETIKQLIQENETLTHIATRIYFRQSSVDYKKISQQRNEPIIDKISNINFCDVTVLTPINKNMSPHLASCDIIEKIFNFIKPWIQFN